MMTAPTTEEILRVRSQRINSNGNLEHPQELSKRRYATAKYESSGTLKSPYSTSAEAPRHLSTDTGYPPMNILCR